MLECDEFKTYYQTISRADSLKHLSWLSVVRLSWPVGFLHALLPSCAHTRHTRITNITIQLTNISIGNKSICQMVIILSSSKSRDFITFNTRELARNNISIVVSFPKQVSSQKTNRYFFREKWSRVKSSHSYHNMF